MFIFNVCVYVVQLVIFFFFLMIRRPPRSTQGVSSAASDVYKRQGINAEYMGTQFMFEKYQIPAFFIGKSSVLAGYSCGRSTTLVLESGASSTYAVPIQDGYALQTPLIRNDVAGNYLTQYLTKWLKFKGHKIAPRYSFSKKYVNDQPIVEYQIFDKTDKSYEEFCQNEIVRELKESLGHREEPASEAKDMLKAMRFELPDGTEIKDIEEERKKSSRHHVFARTECRLFHRSAEYDLRGHSQIRFGHSKGALQKHSNFWRKYASFRLH
eukprot:TRINITY_DN1938_c0_g1_i2.p1 TRINITY_DN1938_c0_g1~~TRINITY_DN1938_c0_g1_i2.p1  ORF type:complete len:268 (-),score=41.60 TRINITY_DN1938_c0_g1_i2:264-1067(-)